MLQELRAMADMESHRAHPVMASDIATLRRMGVHSFQRLLKANSWTTLTGKELQLATGTKMTPAQRRALQRLSRLLTTDPRRIHELPYTERTTQAHEGAIVHHAYRQQIRSLGLCSSSELKDTPLGALWEVTRCPLPSEEAIADLQANTIAFITPARRPKSANIRTVEAGEENAPHKEGRDWA